MTSSADRQRHRASDYGNSLTLALLLIALVSGAAPAQTLRKLLAAHGLNAGRDAPRDLDRRVAGYAVEDARDLFVVAFYDEGAGQALADTIHVSAFDRGRGRWTHAALDRRRIAPDGAVGSVVEINHTARHILLDTHVSPSAGTIVVLSRELTPVTALPGWVLRLLPNDIVVYHRSMVHFAPTHASELWIWDAVSRRHSRLHPNPPWQPARRAYIDSTRAIYARLGSDWFREHNHHMDPERFDSRLVDSVLVGADGRSLAFHLTFGGGETTPVATPPLDVIVSCRSVGSARARCTEEPLASLERRHPGWRPTQILKHLLAQPTP